MGFSRQECWSRVPLPSPMLSIYPSPNLPCPSPSISIPQSLSLFHPPSLFFIHTETHTHTFILSHVRLFFTPRTAAHQAPLSMGCSRQEYWSGLPCSPPGDLRSPGIKPICFMSPALAGGFFTSNATIHLDRLFWWIHLVGKFSLIVLSLQF